jgi:hypothetical protein
MRSGGEIHLQTSSAWRRLPCCAYSINPTEQASVALGNLDVCGSWLRAAGSGATSSMSSYVGSLDLAVPRTGIAVDVGKQISTTIPQKSSQRANARSGGPSSGCLNFEKVRGVLVPHLLGRKNGLSTL